MARNIVPCQAWVNHKKGSKWTEEEVLLGLQELGIILDQEFEGVVGKHHWVIYPNGNRRHVPLRCVLSGQSVGNYFCWDEESVKEALRSRGFELNDPFSGRIRDTHSVTWPDGTINNSSLTNIIEGKIKGYGIKSPYTTDLINQKLAEYGAILAEDFSGRIGDNHLITFYSGLTKSVRLDSVLSGRTTGKLYSSYLDTEDINERLSLMGCVLAEAFKGDINKKHLITFPSGVTANACLKTVLNGKTKGKRFNNTITINERLEKHGAILAEPYKGTIDQNHLVTFLETGKTFNTNLTRVFNGNCKGRLHTIGKHTDETIAERLSVYGASLLEEFKGSVMLKHEVQFNCGHTNTASLNSIIRGTGCPICAGSRFNPDLPGTLYFIEVYHEGMSLYKVGVTNRTIKERYRGEGVKYTVVESFSSDKGSLVYEAEQSILKFFKDYLYAGESPFRKLGVSEVFIENISESFDFMNIVSAFNFHSCDKEG